MSWVQVYVKGLPKSVDPSDEEIESMLEEKFGLSSIGDMTWAGEGTTLIKREDDGCCRGFAFLSFYSAEGAAAAVDRINSSEEGGLVAELSRTDNKKDKKKKKNGGGEDNLHDLRLRRQRKAPIRKHPVITSSDGKRTNLGNKTK